MPWEGDVKSLALHSMALVTWLRSSYQLGSTFYTPIWSRLLLSLRSVVLEAGSSAPGPVSAEECKISFPWLSFSLSELVSDDSPGALPGGSCVA